MKNLLVAVMLAALCAWAQPSSQQKSNDQPAQPQSASPPAQQKSDNAGQPQPENRAQPSDKDGGKPQPATTPAAPPAALARLPVVCLEHTAWWVHMDPTWSFQGGDLSLSDDSIKVSCPGQTLSVPISDIRSLERKSAPAGVSYLRITPRKGKKVDFFPAQAGSSFSYGGDEVLAALEKAIRDRASQHGVVLK